MEPLRTTLGGTARRFWRHFAPAWVFPVVFLYGGVASESLGHALLFFVLVVTPLFFWSFFRSTRPHREKLIPYWHWVFWGVLVPFLVWGVAVLTRLALLRQLRNAA